MASAARTQLDLWPYEEARRLAERVVDYPPERERIFESGFGPSGLPHLGTMGEVLRPAYVQHAFKVLGRSLGQVLAKSPRRDRPWRRRVRPPQPPHRFHRRHGRAAQGPRKHPQPRGDRALSGPAGVADSRPLRRMPSKFRRAHDRAARKIPRAGRGRLRADALERDVRERPLRRSAQTDPRQARRDHPHRHADAARGESRRMVAVHAAVSRVRAGQLDPA